VKSPVQRVASGGEKGGGGGKPRFGLKKISTNAAHSSRRPEAGSKRMGRKRGFFGKILKQRKKVSQSPREKANSKGEHSVQGKGEAMLKKTFVTSAAIPEKAKPRQANGGGKEGKKKPLRRRSAEIFAREECWRGSPNLFIEKRKGKALLEKKRKNEYRASHKRKEGPGSKGKCAQGDVLRGRGKKKGKTALVFRRGERGLVSVIAPHRKPGRRKVSIGQGGEK